MKHIILSALTIFTITLAACSSSSSAAIPTGSTQADSGLLTVTQLALGTLKLEDTEYAITSEQANELLPMWQIYKELITSDTAAQEEVDALIDQIQETMTPEQTQMISDMQLTQQDVLTAMQGSTVVTNVSQSSSSVTSSTGGGIPAGGPPDGGGVPLDIGGGMPGDFGGQTQITQSSSNIQKVTGAPTALVEALIQSLEQKMTA